MLNITERMILEYDMIVDSIFNDLPPDTNNFVVINSFVTEQLLLRTNYDRAQIEQMDQAYMKWLEIMEERCNTTLQ